MNTPALDNDNSQPEPGPLNGIRVLDIATVYWAQARTTARSA